MELAYDTRCKNTYVSAETPDNVFLDFASFEMGRKRTAWLLFLKSFYKYPKVRDVSVIDKI